MKRLVDKALEYQIKNKIIFEDERALYVYAYTILFEECVNLVVAFLIAVLFGKVRLVIFFLGSYIPLRRFAGGYHADSGLKCGIISSLLIIALCVYERLGIFEFIQNRYFILMIAQFFIIILAPVDSNNRRLYDYEKRDYHKITIILLLIQILLIFFGILMKKNNLIGGIIYSHIVLSCMLFLGICQNSLFYLNRSYDNNQ